MSEEKMIFQVPATIEKVETMAKGLKLRIDTYEIISPDAMMRLMTLIKTDGYFTFNTHEIQPEDIIDLPPVNKKGVKSPSKRLRDILYRCFEQDQSGFSEFNDYYETMIEKLINHYKGKLDDV